MLAVAVAAATVRALTTTSGTQAAWVVVAPAAAVPAEPAAILSAPTQMKT